MLQPLCPQVPDWLGALRFLLLPLAQPARKRLPRLTHRMAPRLPIRALLSPSEAPSNSQVLPAAAAFLLIPQAARTRISPALFIQRRLPVMWAQEPLC